MAGHNLRVTFESGITGQPATEVERIIVSDKAVEQLMPGTPSETVDIARDAFLLLLRQSVSAKGQQILDAFKRENVTVQS